MLLHDALTACPNTGIFLMLRQRMLPSRRLRHANPASHQSALFGVKWVEIIERKHLRLCGPRDILQHHGALPPYLAQMDLSPIEDPAGRVRPPSSLVRRRRTFARLLAGNVISYPRFRLASRKPRSIGHQSSNEPLYGVIA